MKQGRCVCVCVCGQGSLIVHRAVHKQNPDWHLATEGRAAGQLGRWAGDESAR